MILVSDFDDTLCPRDNESDFQNNLAAVQKFRHAGNIFCLATGRSLSSLKRRWTDYQDYLDYLILDNGSMCLGQQDQVIFECTIPLSVAEAMRQAINSQFASTAQISFVYYHDMTEWESADTDITKLRCWVNKDNIANEITAMLDRDFSEQTKAFPFFNVFASGLSWQDPTVDFTSFVDIISHEAGKDQAITRLGQMLNSQNIITVGDDMNDLAMIQKFHGYVMDNSTLSRMNVVEPGYITPSVSSLITKLLEQ